MSPLAISSASRGLAASMRGRVTKNIFTRDIYSAIIARKKSTYNVNGWKLFSLIHNYHLQYRSISTVNSRNGRLNIDNNEQYNELVWLLRQHGSRGESHDVLNIYASLSSNSIFLSRPFTERREIAAIVLDALPPTNPKNVRRLKELSKYLRRDTDNGVLTLALTQALCSKRKFYQAQGLLLTESCPMARATGHLCILLARLGEKDVLDKEKSNILQKVLYHGEDIFYSAIGVGGIVDHTWAIMAMRGWATVGDPSGVKRVYEQLQRRNVCSNSDSHSYEQALMAAVVRRGNSTVLSIAGERLSLLALVTPFSRELSVPLLERAFKECANLQTYGAALKLWLMLTRSQSNIVTENMLTSVLTLQASAIFRLAFWSTRGQLTLELSNGWEAHLTDELPERAWSDLPLLSFRDPHGLVVQQHFNLQRSSAVSLNSPAGLARCSIDPTQPPEIDELIAFTQLDLLATTRFWPETIGTSSINASLLVCNVMAHTLAPPPPEKRNCLINGTYAPIFSLEEVTRNPDSLVYMSSDVSVGSNNHSNVWTSKTTGIPMPPSMLTPLRKALDPRAFLSDMANQGAIGDTTTVASLMQLKLTNSVRQPSAPGSMLDSMFSCLDILDEHALTPNAAIFAVLFRSCNGLPRMNDDQKLMDYPTPAAADSVGVFTMDGNPKRSPFFWEMNRSIAKDYYKTYKFYNVAQALNNEKGDAKLRAVSTQKRGPSKSGRINIESKGSSVPDYMLHPVRSRRLDIFRNMYPLNDETGLFSYNLRLPICSDRDRIHHPCMQPAEEYIDLVRKFNATEHRNVNMQYEDMDDAVRRSKLSDNFMDLRVFDVERFMLHERIAHSPASANALFRALATQADLASILSRYEIVLLSWAHPQEISKIHYATPLPRASEVAPRFNAAMARTLLAIGSMPSRRIPFYHDSYVNTDNFKNFARAVVNDIWPTFRKSSDCVLSHDAFLFSQPPAVISDLLLITGKLCFDMTNSIYDKYMRNRSDHEISAVDEGHLSHLLFLAADLGLREAFHVSPNKVRDFRIKRGNFDLAMATSQNLSIPTPPEMTDGSAGMKRFRERVNNISHSRIESVKMAVKKLEEVHNKRPSVESTRSLFRIYCHGIVDRKNRRMLFLDPKNAYELFLDMLNRQGFPLEVKYCGLLLRSLSCHPSFINEALAFFWRCTDFGLKWKPFHIEMLFSGLVAAGLEDTADRILDILRPQFSRSGDMGRIEAVLPKYRAKQAKSNYT